MPYIPKIIAVDFDGTLVKDDYPDIGEVNWLLLDVLKFIQRYSDTKLILWSCRTGDKLQEAVEACNKYGLRFDAVNENLPEIVKLFGGDNRKVYADLYLDDKSLNPWTNVPQYETVPAHYAESQLLYTLARLANLNQDILIDWNYEWRNIR